MLTIRARLKPSIAETQQLEEVAAHLSQVERLYFKERYVKGRTVGEIKKEFIRKHKITARQFNGIRAQCDGRVASAKEGQKRHLGQTKERLSSAKKKLKELGSRVKKTWADRRHIHQLKRKVVGHKSKVERIEEREKNPVPRIAFGSNKLFRKQFHLEENGYKDKAEWKSDWENSRSSSFYCLGSKDETAGNQTCQMVEFDKKGRGRLKVRLPDKLLAEGDDKYLYLDIGFSYHIDYLRSALAAGTALSWQFFRKRKSHKKTGRPTGPWRWYAHVSFVPVSPKKTVLNEGALGVDINQDMLAMTHVDGSGNIVHWEQIEALMTDRRKNQTLDSIGVAVRQIVEYAKEHSLPIYIEKLDFSKKKSSMIEMSKRRRRQLSSFSYNAAGTFLKSAGAKAGIPVSEVNPAFSSIIGLAKFAKGYGVSTHTAAAAVIARRGLGFSNGERLCGRRYSHGKTGNATSLPERNRQVHVWSDWSRFAAARKRQQLAEWKKRKKKRKASSAKQAALTARESSPLLVGGDP